MPTLVDKFSDSKLMVRIANLKVIKQLLAIAGGQKIVAQLSVGMRHTNWVVREGCVNACTMVRFPAGPVLKLCCCCGCSLEEAVTGGHSQNAPGALCKLQRLCNLCALATHRCAQEPSMP
eukprot:180115-Chlamydomonas_euryale.AAC.2